MKSQTSARRIGALTVASVALALPLFGGIAAASRGDAPPASPDTDRDALVETVQHGRGRINYGAGVVKATGYGALPANRDDITPAQAKLMALGAARADALRTLAMTVSSIQVTATTTVKNYQLENDTVQTKLSALLQGPRVVSESVQSDGTAVVIVELPLYGSNSVASAVFPEILPKRSASSEKPPADADTSSADTPADTDTTTTADSWHGPDQPAVRITPVSGKSAPTDAYGAVDPGPTPASDTGPFTSVLVDCRGLNIEAIMSPKLMDTTGREIYGTLRVTPEYAIETGIVGYPRSMTEALRTARCGAHPLIVKAVRVGDVHRFNPVIALEDGDRILAVNRHSHFLEQTRVIFLVDPLK